MSRSQPCEELGWNVPGEGIGNAQTVRSGEGWLAQRLGRDRGWSIYAEEEGRGSSQDASHKAETAEAMAGARTKCEGRL